MKKKKKNTNISVLQNRYMCTFEQQRKTWQQCIK